MNSNSTVKIPVKIGKHLTNVKIEQKQFDVTCKEFLALVFGKFGVESKNLNKYAIFENANGIESMLNSDDKIVKLWLKWTEVNENMSSVQLIVRKIHSVEEKLLKDSTKNKKLLTKCYKKIRQESKTNIKSINVDNKIKRKKVTNNKKLISASGESKPIQSVPKSVLQQKEDDVATDDKKFTLCPHHEQKIIEKLNENYAQNVNFLKFLYVKLKQQNVNNYKLILNERKSCITNCNSNGTSRSSVVSSTPMETLV